MDTRTKAAGSTRCARGRCRPVGARWARAAGGALVVGAAVILAVLGVA